MDPHRRIYSGTGSYGMSNHRMQNKGRFSPSPMSSPQCNYPYALMLPQQQQKFNSVVTPSTTSFGYSQKPWAPSKFGQGSSQNTGASTGTGGSSDVNFIQLNWKDLLANQNSIGTSGTSQFFLGETQNGNFSKPNSNGRQPPQGQQFYQPLTNYPSQQAYGGNGNQCCQNPNCQDCGQSQNESPIKFQVSVGNHGDGLGAPTYTYTFPQQSQSQQSAPTDHCSSGDTYQAPSYPCSADADPQKCPADNNIIVPASTAAMKETGEAPTVAAPIAAPQPDQNIPDPCGSCSACKFKSTTKSTRRTFVGIPTKNNKPAAGLTPKVSVEKVQPPVISPSSKSSTFRKSSTPSIRVGTGTTKSNANNLTKKNGK